MTSRRILLAAIFLPIVSACNMVISEAPMFAEADRESPRPRDGLWVSEDPECRFDTNLPQAQWPECAFWLVVQSSAGEVVVQDNKGQSQPARFLIARGQPPVVQLLWRDEAKEDGKSFHVFFGIEPGQKATDGTFTAAATWEVKCGIKAPSGSKIEPYAGISPECRPSSQDAIRAAAETSRPTAEMAMRWRWLRPEAR